MLTVTTNAMDPYEPPQPPTPPQATGGSFSNPDAKQWCLYLHFSQLINLIVPGLGIAAPIIIWQIKKEQFPELDPHGKMVTNWLISLLIYSLIAAVAAFATCGIGMVLFIPVGLVAIVFPIIGGIKANNGILWKYPLTLTFIK